MDVTGLLKGYSTGVRGCYRSFIGAEHGCYRGLRGVYSGVTAVNQGVNCPLKECYRVINGLLLRLSRV